MNRFLILPVVLALPGKYRSMMRPKSETMAVRLPRFSVVCAAALAAGLIAAGTPARAGFALYPGFDMGVGNATLGPNSAIADASFRSALTGVGIQDFDSLPTGPTNFPTSLTFTSTVTATVMNPDPTDNYLTSSLSGGAHAISTPNYLLSNGSANGLDLTLSFASTPIAGIGFVITDLANGSREDQIMVTLTTTNSSGPVTSTTSSTNEVNNGVGDEIWFGVVSTDPMQKITSVVIQNTNLMALDVFGIDNLTIGTAAVVPEPASIVLMGIGVLGLAVGHVRRGRNWSRPA